MGIKDLEFEKGVGIHMTKQDFLQQLQSSLISSEVEQRLVSENITYYREYIEGEVLKGRLEEEVLAQLGSPRLIAKTIIETHAGDAHGDSRYEEVDDVKEVNFKGKTYRMPHWLFKILTICVIVVAIVLGFTILRVLLPYIIFALVVVYIMKLFKKVS